MQTLDIVAALPPMLVSMASWLAWRRVKQRIVRHGFVVDRVVWLGQSMLAFIAAMIIMAPAIWLLLRLGRPEVGLFYGRFADGLALTLVVSMVVGGLGAGPVAAPSSLRPEATVPADRRAKLRDLRSLALASLVSGAALGLCVYRAARAEMSVSESCIQSETFWGDRARICANGPYSIVQFERRGGIVGRSRSVPHLVVVGPNRHIDSFYVARDRQEELSRVLARVFPAPRVARELHRVGFWGETIEGLEGLP